MKRSVSGREDYMVWNSSGRGDGIGGREGVDEVTASSPLGSRMQVQTALPRKGNGAVSWTRKAEQ